MVLWGAITINEVVEPGLEIMAAKNTLPLSAIMALPVLAIDEAGHADDCTSDHSCNHGVHQCPR